MQNIVETAVIPVLTLKAGGKDYLVEFPLTAVIKAEEKLGRSLKSFQEWWDMRAQDIPSVLEAGLSKHHPEVTPEQMQAICDGLNPESLNVLRYAMCKLAFPKVMERWEESRLKGNTSPNV